MAFEELMLRINMLVTEMENKPEDAHELLEQLHMELQQLKALGQPLPDDLVNLEKLLEQEFEAAAKANMH
ncbi:MAG: hypothetical protein ACR2OM_10620 [Aestuariivirgaceae bacterium]